MEEKRNNIFYKIKKYFVNIFRKDIKQLEESKKYNDYSNSDFRENVIIPEDKEKTRLLKLQHEFESGNILEEEINDEDFKKLHELYDEQIEDINSKIELYKNKILKIKGC